MVEDSGKSSNRGGFRGFSETAAAAFFSGNGGALSYENALVGRTTTLDGVHPVAKNTNNSFETNSLACASLA